MSGVHIKQTDMTQVSGAIVVVASGNYTVTTRPLIRFTTFTDLKKFSQPQKNTRIH